MTSLVDNPLFSRLSGVSRVLGAGGGFDIYAGLPIALALMTQGKQVSLANLTFSQLYAASPRWLLPSLAEITPETTGLDGYFPERTLSRWLESRNLPSTVYAIDHAGVRPVRAAYAHLCALHAIDAIVLVDGGTDILMRGDESGLGTPEEDATSLAAVASLDEIPTRLLACIGFGVDAYHGVCHSHFLENVAALERDGAYLGCFSVPRRSAEAVAFLDAVGHAHLATPQRPSIVNGSIAAAISGDFGNAQFTSRTVDAELYINPLMAMYWAFEAQGVARRSLYLPLLADTEQLGEVSEIIARFRQTVTLRRPRRIPH